MATIRYTVTITDANGNTLAIIPSTSKQYATRIGNVRARELGGKPAVKEICPVEYNPANW